MYNLLNIIIIIISSSCECVEPKPISPSWTEGQAWWKAVWCRTRHPVDDSFPLGDWGRSKYPYTIVRNVVVYEVSAAILMADTAG